MIQTEKLFFSYKNQSELQFRDLNIRVHQHSLLIGASGCGKTTLLHILSGLRKPTSGLVKIAGTDITGLNASALDRFRGQNIGLVFQTSHFLKSISIRDNLRLTASLAKAESDNAWIETLLDKLGIIRIAHKSANQLSTGEQQRAAIARALVSKPKILLADEPTSALDDNNANQVIELLKSQAEAYNTTLLIVTHDQRLKKHFANHIEL